MHKQRKLCDIQQKVFLPFVINMQKEKITFCDRGQKMIYRLGSVAHCHRCASTKTKSLRENIVINMQKQKSNFVTEDMDDFQIRISSILSLMCINKT